MKDMINKAKDNVLFQFIYGAGGIYLFAFMGSVLHQKLLKFQYDGAFGAKKELFAYPVALVIFPYLSGFLIGSGIKYARKEQSMKLPKKNLFYAGLAVAVGTITYNIAIVETSYPAVIMVKSCSILSVIIVGVCCSRVRDQHNKLQKRKLVMGLFVAIGIVLFNLFGNKKDDTKSTTIFGIILLLVSLLADGFLPDLQAQIKTVYKPKPVDLMSQINKWVFLISLSYSVVAFQFLPIVQYMIQRPQFVLDMFLFSISSTLCQLFVYYMIQKFRQHIVPFIITVRKILSVVLSILWFGHDINSYQILGIVVVFLAAIFDFLYGKYCDNKSHQTKQSSNPQQFNQINASNVTLQDTLQVQSIDPQHKAQITLEKQEKYISQGITVKN